MPTACLDEELACAFAQGQASEADSALAEQHLDDCAQCQELVALLALVATRSSGGPAHATTGELAAGDRVGRFTIVRRVGEGASSLVYEARDDELERSVAIKILRTDASGSQDPRKTTRLFAEARSLARLSHRNVVVVHEVGTHEDAIFMALEFVRGTTLREWLNSGRSELHEILGVFLEAGEGLAAAHAQGLVHRDFKPENVLVGDDGRVRVTDFGLALASRTPAGGLQKSDLEQTHSGVCVGTPAYMPPEQWHGSSDARSDQFSFGVALFEALCGHRPFAGEVASQVIANVLAGAVQGRITPAWLHRIVLRALSTDPLQRFASMSAMLSALRAGMIRRKRRLWSSAIAAGLVTAVGVGSFLASTNEQAPACGSQGKAIHERWGQQRIASLRAAVEESADIYAPGAWIQTKAHLDGYVARWSGASAEVCKRQRLEHDAPEMVALMDQCLATGLRDFEVLVDVLVEDAPSPGDMVKSTAALGDPWQCTTTAHLKTLAPERDEHAPSRGALARAQALFETGRYQQASDSMDAALAQARELGDRKSESGALLLSCGAGARLGKMREAEAACHEAALVASAAGLPDQAARAWSLLVALVAATEARYDDAALWSRYAEAALEQAAGSPEIAAQLSNSRGILAKAQGDHERAREHYLRALALFKERFGEQDLRVAQALNNLAILEGLMGESEAAHEHHQQALAIKKQLLGKTHPDIAISLINIGILHGQARPELARTHYLQALEIAAQSLAADHPVVGAALGNLGNVERALGMYEQALAHMQEARMQFENRLGPGHPRVAAMIENLALVYQAQGESERAIEMLEECLALRETIYPEDHADKANVLNNLGLALNSIGNYAEAHVHLQESLRMRRNMLGHDHVDTTWDLVGLAEAEHGLGRPDKALAPLEQALTLMDTSDEAAPSLRAAAQYQLAQVLRATKGDRARARALGEQALANFEALPGSEASDNADELRRWLADESTED